MLRERRTADGMESHLSRGAWIEIQKRTERLFLFPSHLSRGAWIEIHSTYAVFMPAVSHLSRGAWIEILFARSVS